MLKLKGLLALALICYSAAAAAQQPEAGISGSGASADGEPPRALHWRALPSDTPSEVTSTTPEPSARQAASDGMRSPFTIGAVISASHADVQSYAGYDGAIGVARARAVAEGRLTSFLSMHVEFERGPGTGTENRVSVGGRLGILTQQKYGVDLGVGLFYQPKDFRGEGNIVGGLMFARHFERLGLFAIRCSAATPKGTTNCSSSGSEACTR